MSEPELAVADWAQRANDEKAKQREAATPPASVAVVYGIEYPMPEKLTMGEAADLEEVAGDLSNPGARVALGFLWIAMRRADPRWTIEKVRQLDFDDIEYRTADARPPDGSAA